MRPQLNWIEQQPSKLQVSGSSPEGRTTYEDTETMIKKFKVECIVKFELDDDSNCLAFALGEELYELAGDLCTEYANAPDTFLPSGWRSMPEVKDYDVSCKSVSFITD